MSDGLTLVPDGDLELALAPSREEMLEAIPLHVVIDPDVDLDAEDPAHLVDSRGRERRVCISTRRAGGRCTVAAPGDSLLCAVHSGRLDPSTGGKAKARKHREASGEAEAEARLGRLGTRGVIAATMAENAGLVRSTVLLLLREASQGDLQAAKALIPYFNQGLGMPTERVEMLEPSSSADLEGMTTADLAAFVAARRRPAAAS